MDALNIPRPVFPAQEAIKTMRRGGIAGTTIVVGSKRPLGGADPQRGLGDAAAPQPRRRAQHRRG
jgi:hypothetical protein